MATFTVLLTNDTVGTIVTETVSIGDHVTVDLHDENGMPTKVSGDVAEILIETL